MSFLFRHYRQWNPGENLTACIVLLLVSFFAITQIIYPYVCIVSLLCLALITIVYFRPMIGIYLLTLLYPMASIAFFIRTQQPQTLIINCDEIISFILLLVLIFRQLSDRHKRPLQNEYLKGFADKWIFYLLALFICWSLVAVFRSENQFVSLYGLWRLICGFIIIAYIVLYIDSCHKFIKAIVCYCFAAAIYALSAIYATHFAFLVNYHLFNVSDIYASFTVSLFNQPAGFVSQIVGMLNGVGFAPKHDLAMLLASGVLFAIFLMKIYESTGIRCILFFFILLCMTIIYQLFSRTATVGMLLVVHSFFFASLLATFIEAISNPIINHNCFR